jgi:predicted deacylase
MDHQSTLACFSASYAEARSKFIAAATQRGLAIESELLALPGADGEALAMDVVRDGPADASRMLVVISGVHGVEGYCGSAIQTGLLAQGIRPSAPDTAVLYVHAVNPFGFSHLRRATQENVDLNRNFVDFGQPLPVNAGYGEIHDALLPVAWPPSVQDEAVLADYRERHGARGLQRAMALGQHTHCAGLHYGGLGPTWSNDTFRAVLRRHGPAVRYLASVDIHTGLGPRGHGERIFASFDPDPAVLALATRWWGNVTDVTAGTSASIPLTGPIQTALHEECSRARHVGICLEFGTHPMPRVMNALRAEHWLHRHGADTAQSAAIRRELKDAFYPDADDWKLSVAQQGREACLQALEGLQEPCPLPIAA